MEHHAAINYCRRSLFALLSLLFVSTCLGTVSHTCQLSDLGVFGTILIPEEGYYEIRAWICPPLTSSGLTSYCVTMDEEEIGCLSPQTSGWQWLGLEQGSIYLRKGKKSIKVFSSVDPTPLTEKIEAIRYDDDAKNSPLLFDAYLEKAIANTESYYTSKYSSPVRVLQRSAGSQGQIYFSLPVRYSFYKIIHCETGERLLVTSSSEVEHDIDAIYYGASIPTSMGDDSEPARLRYNTSGLDIDTMPVKIQVTRILPTDAQNQGLNWKAISEPSPSGNYQDACLDIKAPYEGYYVVKGRTRGNGDLNVADIEINGLLFSDCPIAYTSVPSSIPADGNMYSSMTIAEEQSDPCDPILWIHGADGDRIVACNDDASSSQRARYPIGSRDGCVEVSYSIPPTAVEVSGYSSLNPEGSCTLLEGMANPSEIDSLIALAPFVAVECRTNEAAPSKPKGSLLTNELSEPETGPLFIKIYAPSGACLTSSHCDGAGQLAEKITDAHLPSGFYILCLETRNGFRSHKLHIPSRR